MFSTKDIVINDNFIDGDQFENLAIDNVKYIKIDDIDFFLKNTDLSKINFEILITHNGDKCITDDMVNLAFHSGSKIKKWCSQNINTTHPKLFCIPIGLERKRWFPALNKQYQLQHTIIDHNIILTDKHIHNLCYANFSINTNVKSRIECLKYLNSSFCTLKTYPCVKQDFYINYSNYLTEILHHYFVICPEGNGIDTHRMWETLYLGRIPIVIKNYVTESFKDLPILILNSWNELTYDLLLEYIKKFKNNEITYSIDKLRMSYWKKEIYEK